MIVKKRSLDNFIDYLKTDSKILSFDEAATKQVIILGTFKLFGWNSDKREEVYPEYTIKSGKKVDYSLRINKTDKIFVEVKKVNTNLEKYQEKLLEYSFQEEVLLSILTDGIKWWFYLPMKEGELEEKKFLQVDIKKQEAAEIEQKFNDLLSRSAVSSGDYIENAEEIFSNNQKIIQITLPIALKELIYEAEEVVTNLISDYTKKICGLKPAHETVVKFLYKKFSSKGGKPKDLIESIYNKSKRKAKPKRKLGKNRSLVHP